MTPSKPLPSHPLTVSMSCFTSNAPSGDGWTITVSDAISGDVLIELDMAPAAFGLALGARANQAAILSRFNTESLGTIREHKTMAVVVPTGTSFHGKNAADKAAILAPYEIDDWRGYHGDLGNGHCKLRGADQDAYSVSFSRRVPYTAESLRGRLVELNKYRATPLVDPSVVDEWAVKS